MQEFIIAAERAVEDESAGQQDEEIYEFKIGDEQFAARRPTPGQTNVLFAASNSIESTRLTWRFLRNTLLDDGYLRLRGLVEEGKIPPRLLFGGDDLNESGIVDSIIAGFAGRPTQSLVGSAPSQSSDGPRSTGRVKSTPSRSRSTDT